MGRVVLVTDIDTSLGNQLVRLFLEDGDRVFATSADQDSLTSFNQVAGDSLKVFQWNRRSPVSARNVMLKALAAFDAIDALVLLGPPDLGGLPLLQLEAAAIEEEVDCWIKGSTFLARELLAYFSRRRAGMVALVAQNPASGGGAVGEIARGGFRGLTWALLRGTGTVGESVMVNGFESSSPNIEDYAGFVHRALQERARRSPGKLLRHPGGLAATLRRR
jgi:NAD(P)-dependent dehydrogenase (short-subunit alcohol dehydrogenase family)